jgi:hypothetical protein
MPRIATVTRILLGLGFTLFSLNYFIPFLPTPEPPPADAIAFIGPFAASGFLTLVKAIELAAGIALLTNRFVPLALALLAPIVVGIVAFHVLLAPAGIPMVAVFLALELATAWAYRGAFKPMLAARVAPAEPQPLAHGARSANVT